MRGVKKRSPHLSYEHNLAVEWVNRMCKRFDARRFKPPSLAAILNERDFSRAQFLNEVLKTKAPARVKAAALIYFDDQMAKLVEQQTALYLLATLEVQSKRTSIRDELNHER